MRALFAQCCRVDGWRGVRCAPRIRQAELAVLIQTDTGLNEHLHNGVVVDIIEIAVRWEESGGLVVHLAFFQLPVHRDLARRLAEVGAGRLR